MTRHTRCLAPLGFLLAVWSSGSASAQNQAYALFELARLDGPSSDTTSINEVGEITGYSDVGGGAYYHAVAWDRNGIPTDVGAMGFRLSVASDVNELGEVVGWTGDNGITDQQAFLWRNGELLLLGTLGGEESEAYAINDLSQVVGVAEAVVGGGGFLWENGKMTALPTLGQSGQGARDINESSQIVGSSIDVEGRERAVIWDGGGISALPSLHTGDTVALAINNRSQIVGQSKSRFEKWHAVAWTDGKIFDLHRSELGPHSAAFGLNDVGQVVGWVGQQPSGARAFVWDQANGMQTLDSLMPPRLRKNWTLIMAQGVNDAGQIAAFGNVRGQPLTLIGFRVNPVHPTMELSSPVPGAAPGPNTLTLTGATPGAEVVFLYALHSGGTRIDGCDLQQNALQLDHPTVIGSAVANENGVATITRHVPLLARGQTILFQAVVQDECAISQLVVWQFE